jgi:hypothetical protein
MKKVHRLPPSPTLRGGFHAPHENEFLAESCHSTVAAGINGPGGPDENLIGVVFTPGLPRDRRGRAERPNHLSMRDLPQHGLPQTVNTQSCASLSVLHFQECMARRSEKFLRLRVKSAWKDRGMRNDDEIKSLRRPSDFHPDTTQMWVSAFPEEEQGSGIV